MANEQLFHLGIKAIITNENGEILLLKVNEEMLRGDHGDYWDIPGGRVQDGYSVEETLRKEVEEETGITTVFDISFVTAVVSNIRIPLDDDEEVGLVLHIYSASIDNEDIVISEEHTTFGWFEPTEAADLLAIKYPEEFTKLVNEM